VKTRPAILPLILFLTHSVHAGGLPEVVFDSGFEFAEQCTEFDGLNDTIMVPSVNISGTFKINGQFFPLVDYDDAVFSLRDRVTGDVFELGNSHDQTFSVNVVPGRYDVLYSLQSPGEISPRNVGALVMENVALLESGPLHIDVVAYTLGGDMLHNGAPFPASQYDDGLIFLDSETKGQVRLGETQYQSFSGMVVLAGTYEVRYQVETPGTVPENEWGFAGTLEVSGDENGLQINVPSVPVAGRFSHNGVPFPPHDYDDGNLYLETTDGDRVFLENSHSGGFEKNIIPGQYNAYWEVETPGETVPINERVRVGENLAVSEGTLNIDVVSHAISGAITLNGGAFPDTFQNTGRITLRDKVTGVHSLLALTLDGGYADQVAEGTYEFFYHHIQGDLVPRNEYARLGTAVPITSDGVFAVDVAAELVGVTVYQNGILFPDSPQQMGNILLRDPASDDFVLLGKTSLQDLWALVVPGTYDSHYSHLIGDQVPQNHSAPFQQNFVVSPPDLMNVLDGVSSEPLGVGSLPITGSMLLNGDPMPPTDYDDGLITLQWGEDLVPIANTHEQSYQSRVVYNPAQTVYWIHYENETPGEMLPVNSNARIGCVILTAPIL